MEPDTKDPAAAVRASEARKIAGGGRRIPGGVMPADVADALDTLKAEGYAATATGCIFLAIIEAAERVTAANERLRGAR